jgi:phosphate transport system protein
MTQPTHLDEAIDRDTEALRRRVRKVADLVLKALEDSILALQKRDRRLAYTVILSDNRIDVLEGHIDRLCQEFLVRHMPVAAQLRFIVALNKVNSELERIGDYAEAIARRAVALTTATELPAQEPLFAMARISFGMLRQAVDAFLLGDPDLASATLEIDNQVNEMNRTIFHELSHPESDAVDLTTRFVLLGVLNRIERVADRACNIAEEATYVAKGKVLRHLPRHDLRVLFLCDRNACRSQMAEAIARSQAPAHFIFTSAGPAPEPLDPGTVQFMAGKGMDISRQKPKGLADVGSLNDYHVIVTLSQEAEEACPQVPYKAVALNWEIPDPSKATGTPEEIGKSYEAVYDELRTKIGELLDSLMGARGAREEEEES